MQVQQLRSNVDCLQGQLQSLQEGEDRLTGRVTDLTGQIEAVRQELAGSSREVVRLTSDLTTAEEAHALALQVLLSITVCLSIAVSTTKLFRRTQLRCNVHVNMAEAPEFGCLDLGVLKGMSGPMVVALSSVCPLQHPVVKHSSKGSAGLHRAAMWRSRS